jgi:hypothetical protein
MIIDYINPSDVAPIVRKVKTAYVYPPIPCRAFDWCAYLDGEEEKGNVAWGETEKEAIENLNEILGS